MGTANSGNDNSKLGTAVQCLSGITTDDCIAICAPGAVLTVVLLVERIVLFPRSNPCAVRDITPQTEEVYDLLIRPEDRDVDHVLLVSPHLLFKPEDPTGSFAQQVKCSPLLGNDIANWQYPQAPQFDGHRNLTVGVHRINPSTPLIPGPILQMSGTFHAAQVSIPDEILGEETLSALAGLRRTVFRCTFDVPIKMGEQRWLRLRVTPDKLSTPCQAEMTTDHLPAASRVNVAQTLDILGADTMLGSFNDNLEMIVSKQLRQSLTKTLTDADLIGLQRLRDFAFEKGFYSEGTYTRIEDQRILLVPRDCQIDTKFFEGSVSFQGIFPVETEWGNALCYLWSSGLNAYSRHDPIAVAESVARHVKEWAPNQSLGKSKPDIAVATSSEYVLCCAVVEQLVREGYLGRVGNVDSFYWNNKDLPSDPTERWRKLVSITKPIAQSMILNKAHFRVFYVMRFTQVPLDLAARDLREKRLVTLFRVIAVAGLLIGLTSLTIAIARTFNIL